MRLYWFLGVINSTFAVHYWMDARYLLSGIAILAWLVCMLVLYKKNEMLNLETDSD